MADRQKQQLKEAVTVIRDGLKFQIERSEKMKEPAFTARSRDIGITNPNIKKDVSREQLTKGAMGAAYIAADYFLNPEKYSARNLKNKASIKFVEETAKLGAGYVNRMMPPGLNFELDFMDMNVDEVKRGGRPAVRARYETRDPFDYGGTFGVEARASQGERGASLRYRAPTDKITEAIIGKPFAKKAKGGKVKKYSKGGGVRKPKLK